ncbi:MAG: hypothetical protein WBL20_07790 [Sphingobium sp.]|uniref:hypothetical protein n=1 Tax=Sphingobium sp. TaxID=1912891 RepID=UPI003BB027B2
MTPLGLLLGYFLIGAIAMQARTHAIALEAARTGRPVVMVAALWVATWPARINRP